MSQYTNELALNDKSDMWHILQLMSQIIPNEYNKQCYMGLFGVYLHHCHYTHRQRFFIAQWSIIILRMNFNHQHY